MNRGANKAQESSTFRVRESASRHGNTGWTRAENSSNVTSPTLYGLNNSKTVADADDVEADINVQRILDEEAAADIQRGGAMNIGGGTSKPFLEQLFEDLKTSEEEVEMERQLMEEVNGLGSLSENVLHRSYKDMVRIQCAKPNVMQFCVSTDAVPLPTKTGPITYTQFDVTQYREATDPTFGDGNRRRHMFAGAHAAMEMRRSRDALLLPCNRLWNSKRRIEDEIRQEKQREMMQQAAAASGELLRAGALEPVTSGWSYYNEEEELQKSHLQFLLAAVEMKKSEMLHRGTRRQPWIG